MSSASSLLAGVAGVQLVPEDLDGFVGPGLFSDRDRSRVRPATKEMEERGNATKRKISKPGGQDGANVALIAKTATRSVALACRICALGPTRIS
jgi:hypothetical protein